MPDRQIELTLSLTFIATISEEELIRDVQQTIGRDNSATPTPIETEVAFNTWRAHMIDGARRNFITGNHLGGRTNIKVVAS